MPDIAIVASTSLAEGIIGAVQFPVVISTADNLIDDATGIEQICEEIDGVETNFLDLTEQFLQAFSEALDLAPKDDACTDMERKTAEDLRSAIEAVPLELTGDPAVDALNEAKTSGSVKRLMLQKDVGIKVNWVNVRIDDRPSLAIGNPIVVSNILVHLQAQIRACVRLFGKDFCVTVTSPNVRLEGKRAIISLNSSGPKVNGVFSFDDIDIVILFKIKWIKFSIKIGVTKIVNSQIIKNGPIQVADLSYIEQKIPLSSKSLTISQIAFSSLPEGLLISVNTSIS